MNNINWPLGSASGVLPASLPMVSLFALVLEIRSLDGAQKIESVPLYLLRCFAAWLPTAMRHLTFPKNFAPPNHAWLGPWAWCLILAPVPVRDVRKPAMHHTALRPPRAPRAWGKAELVTHSPEDLDLRRLRIESIFRCARPQQQPPSLASLALRHCHCTLEFGGEGGPPSPQSETRRRAFATS